MLLRPGERSAPVPADKGGHARLLAERGIVKAAESEVRAAGVGGRSDEEAGRRRVTTAEPRIGLARPRRTPRAVPDAQRGRRWPTRWPTRSARWSSRASDSTLARSSRSTEAAASAPAPRRDGREEVAGALGSESVALRGDARLGTRCGSWRRRRRRRRAHHWRRSARTARSSSPVGREPVRDQRVATSGAERRGHDAHDPLDGLPTDRRRPRLRPAGADSRAIVALDELLPVAKRNGRHPGPPRAVPRPSTARLCEPFHGERVEGRVDDAIVGRWTRGAPPGASARPSNRGEPRTGATRRCYNHARPP